MTKDQLDEIHAHLNGDKSYIATTVLNAYVLDISIALKADTPSFKGDYSQLQSLILYDTRAQL